MFCSLMHCVWNSFARLPCVSRCRRNPSDVRWTYLHHFILLEIEIVVFSVENDRLVEKPRKTPRLVGSLAQFAHLDFFELFRYAATPLSPFATI